MLLKDAAQGKADASAEKTEASPIVEVLKPVAKRSEKNRRKERWPKDSALEQEVIEPAEVRDNHRALEGRPLLLAGASEPGFQYLPERVFTHTSLGDAFAGGLLVSLPLMQERFH